MDNNHWKEFANHYVNTKTNISKNTIELLELFNNDVELVTVIEELIGTNAMEWIYRKIPALDYLQPIDCKNNEILLNKLKMMLMEIP